MKNRHFGLKLIIVIIFAIICAFILIRFFSKKVNPVFIAYAESEVKNFTIRVVNDAINNCVIDKIDDDLFSIEKNSNGEIQLISYNSKNVNSLLRIITKTVYDNLSLVENGKVDDSFLDDSFYDFYDKSLLKNGIICEIPFGSFFDNSLLSNIGPMIPVRFNLIREVSSNISSNIREYGINNVFLELYVNVIVDTKVILPFVSSNISVSTAIPISLKILQGSIPNYYVGGIESTFWYRDVIKKR